MTHLKVGASQLVLSILFFWILFLRNYGKLGYFKVSIVNNLREVLMLMMSFLVHASTYERRRARKFTHPYVAGAVAGEINSRSTVDMTTPNPALVAAVLY